MAEAIVSEVLIQLGSFLAGELRQHVRLARDAEKDAEKLKSTFEAIQALLLDAEERQLKSESIEIWLKKLKDVSYEIDDVLDEWRTEILKRQLVAGGDHQQVRRGCLELKLLRISDALKRVCCFLPTYGYKFRLAHNIDSKIKSLNERLHEIDEEKKMFNFIPRERSSYTGLQTSPNINSSEVKGREEELKILQHKLLDDGSDNRNVKSISIQGVGGVGKTTLAKILYNDKAVEAHFEKRVWVCVSDKFDLSTVAKAILESFKHYTPGSTLPHMLEEINTHTKDKKFLLVLDDVWEDSRRNWEELIHSVCHGLPGSKIMVTTRKEEVSRVFNCRDDDILHVQKISDDACRAIFMEIAFDGWRAEDKKDVECLCEKVVEKCFGSPLAAKVLGGVLHLKKSKKDWIQLLESEMWQIEKGKEEVLAPLALSYYDLPPAVRQCFQFCAVFPQDYAMRKDELIKLWMSQGFLKATTNQDVEVVGEEYFHMLVMRSFFQDMEKVMETVYCKMHDLVHDFARLTTKNECISILKQDTGCTLPPINNEVRHLMVQELSSEETNKLIAPIDCSHPSSTKHNHSLRSFIARSGGAIEPDVYAHLRGIRSLVLRDCHLKEIPSTITLLIHLRLLDLSENDYLTELPEEICELYNLKAMLLNQNYHLQMLPSGMGNKLVNLKHLENERVPAVLPRSMVRLADTLKTLFVFIVDRDEKEDGVEGATNIGDLERMNQLQGFLIIKGLGKVTNCEEVKRAQLAKKESLTRLELDFDSRGEEEASQREEQVLEAIRPSSSSLEELAVWSYSGGSIVPSWLMSLSNLTSLAFDGCRQVEQLPALGALPSLQELYLGELDKVEKIGLELLWETRVIEQLGMTSNNKGRAAIIIAFPKLTRLMFWGMRNWKVWDVEGDDREGGMISSTTVMPRLRCLELHRCPELEKLPDVLLRKTTLQELEINESGGLGRYRFDDEDPKMVPKDVWDKISHIPTIRFDLLDIRTILFKSEIEAMSGVGCSHSKPEEEEAGDGDDDDHHDEIRSE